MLDRSLLCLCTLWISLVLVAFATDNSAAQDMTVFESECAKGQAADDYPAWEFIANNAVRTADEYAMRRNPKATFILADVAPVFQIAGEYAGEYLVRLVAESSFGTSFAMLRPNFEFCANPAKLNDGRSDLFWVVNAKLNGKPF